MLTPEETKKAKLITENIREFLFNTDLEVAFANSQIDWIDAELKRIKFKTSQYNKKRFHELKLSKEALIQYTEDIIANKNRLMKQLDSILDLYEYRYKKVFVAAFINGKTLQETADFAGLSLERTKEVKRKLRETLLFCFGKTIKK